MNQPPNGRRVSTLLVFLFLCFSACGSPDTASQAGAGSSRPTPSPPSNPSVNSGQDVTEPDNDSSAVNDQEDASDQNSDENSDAEAEHFHGYRCIDDCSGHEAGYRWAEEHDIDDVDNCGGNSQSFIEGCQAWVEEHN